MTGGLAGGGGNYGGGAGGGSSFEHYTAGTGAGGAVRIIWGAGRTFPNNAM
jgi:hypothetical protein